MRIKKAVATTAKFYLIIFGHALQSVWLNSLTSLMRILSKVFAFIFRSLSFSGICQKNC